MFVKELAWTLIAGALVGWSLLPSAISSAQGLTEKDLPDVLTLERATATATATASAATSMPEPSSASLMLLGFAALAGLRLWRKLTA